MILAAAVLAAALAMLGGARTVAGTSPGGSDLTTTIEGRGTLHASVTPVDRTGPPTTGTFCEADSGTCSEHFSYDPGREVYPAVVELTPVPARGWRFAGWSDGGRSDGRAVFTMDGTHAATATFVDAAPTPAFTPLTQRVAGRGFVHGSVRLAARTRDDGEVVSTSLVHVDPTGERQDELARTDGNVVRARWDTTGLTDGAHRLFAWATDDGGVTGASGEFTVNVDNSPPAVRISGPADVAAAAVSGASWPYAASDPTSGAQRVVCRLDDQPIVCPLGGAGLSATGAAPGPHTLSVTATNGAGLSTTASHAFTVTA